ncbi:hypothetical protein CSV67_03900 [Sporosarcina sp. P2]|uniref:hypothetical protein n=1 Tax=Sporosarcina sp. P2 TaxID=2048251 RepID=UPI000C16EECC|nr:hypothetical protein [Sporosarcina sp. P2]PID03792.1 hypothetical protein CSV67_03900 [Sporosarcina sp. P2]
MSLEGLFNWASQEIKWALFIVLFVALIVTAFKRAWIALVGVLIGLAFIGIFIVNPDTLISISEFIAEKLNLGN